MKIEDSPLALLRTWATFNGVKLHNVEIVDLNEQGSSEGKGYGVAAIDDSDPGPNSTLISVPKELVLSATYVEDAVRADKFLREIMDASPRLAQTERGAILLYLFHQTLKSSKSDGTAGISSPWTQYIQFLRPTSLPSTWTTDEVATLEGTSLQAAVRAKRTALIGELEYIRKSTEKLEWFQDILATYEINTSDYQSLWNNLDAWYRSRGFQIPGLGDAAMVPVLDMINHKEGDGTTARYGANDDGEVFLLLKPGQNLKKDTEIHISYGNSRGAAEMLFSYGFIDPTITCANELSLELEVPDDDPLKSAKEYISDTNTVKLSLAEKGIKWESDFIWLICVNEEDGLHFKVLQTQDGSKELKVLWHDQELPDERFDEQVVRMDERYPIFRLRAICLLEQRVEQQIIAINEFERLPKPSHDLVPDSILHQTSRLRDLELELLKESMESLEIEKSELSQNPFVVEYLQSDGVSESPREDFS